MPVDHTLIIFGATGDLCGRHLLPALARLVTARELSAGFRFVGTGPQHWNTSKFREHVRARLATFAADLATPDVDAFVGRLTYCSADVQDPTAIGGLLRDVAEGTSLTCYLALPTHLIRVTVEGLEQAGLPTSARMAVEKPFGSDLPSAQHLNAALAWMTADEGHIFRVDHFLGLPVVQSLPDAVSRMLQVRGALCSDIAAVSILWEETLALEGRAAFYDRAGALKDLLQNHLVQILCQILLDTAGAAPAGWSDRRLQALRSVRIPTADQARAGSRRGRYTAGRLTPAVDGAATVVPDYVAEEGVDASRETETFAQVRLEVDRGEWRSTTFLLRAGKAMGRPRRGVLFTFRQDHFGSAAGDAWIDFDRPPMEMLEEASPAIEQAPLEQRAYVNILRDLLSASNTLSVSRPESEAAWQIFTPVLEQWASGSVPLETYPAGTTPSSAVDAPSRISREMFSDRKER